VVILIFGPHIRRSCTKHRHQEFLGLPFQDLQRATSDDDNILMSNSGLKVLFWQQDDEREILKKFKEKTDRAKKIDRPDRTVLPGF
jgi:hypothetical protein